MIIAYFLRDITDCGGIQQTTCLNINSILKKTTEYTIVTISLYHKYASTFFEINSSVKNYALFEKYVDTKKDFFKIKQKLKRLFRNICVDEIVIQGIAYANYLSNDIWKRYKVIVCEHGHYYMGEKFGLHWFGVKKSLKKASAIISLTLLDAQNYMKHNKNKIFIGYINNPCVFEMEHRETYNINSRTIVSCGTLDKVKRFDHVIEAAKMVLEKYPKWKWHIYGDGTEKKRLQEMIVNYNLQNNVILKGYEKDKSVIYSDKAFLVLTSKFEGFGMVLIEAMQYSLPVISYDINYGPREIVQSGINGYLVKDGNIKMLTQTIESLIVISEKRSKLSKQAFDSLERYSIENITDQWLDLFEHI